MENLERHYGQSESLQRQMETEDLTQGHTS